MSASTSPAVVCPSCAKRYKWQAGAVGRRVGCPCGARFRVPPAPGQAEAPEAPGATLRPSAAAAADIYELAQEAKPAVAAMRVAAAPPASVPLPSSRERSRDGEAADDGRDEGEDEPAAVKLATFGNLYLPLALMALGVIANVLVAQWLTRGFGSGVLYALAMAAVQVVVFLPLGVVALFITANALETEFGDLRIALVKLAAVTLGTGAVADTLFIVLAGQLDFDIYLLGASFFCYMVLCGIPIAVLFRTALDETCMAVGLLTVPRVGLLFTLGITMPQLFHA